MLLHNLYLSLMSGGASDTLDPLHFAKAQTLCKSSCLIIYFEMILLVTMWCPDLSFG